MLKFGSDTLLHAIGFNLMKFEGILKHGIVSYDYAKKHNLPYARNYNFTLNHENDKKYEGINESLMNANNHNIYLVRMLYVSDDPLAAYNLYVTKGISFVIDDVSFISDMNREFIKRSDEIIVKNYIPKSKITGIVVPSELADISLSEMRILPHNIVNCNYILDNVWEYVKYLCEYGHKINLEELTLLCRDLKTAAISLKSLDKNDEDYQEALVDYNEIISDINSVLANETERCFVKILGEELTIMDIISYINSKYGNLEISDLPINYNRKRIR